KPKTRVEEIESSTKDLEKKDLEEDKPSGTDIHSAQLDLTAKTIEPEDSEKEVSTDLKKLKIKIKPSVVGLKKETDVTEDNEQMMVISDVTEVVESITTEDEKDKPKKKTVKKTPRVGKEEKSMIVTSEDMID